MNSGIHEPASWFLWVHGLVHGSATNHELNQTAKMQFMSIPKKNPAAYFPGFPVSLILFYCTAFCLLGDCKCQTLLFWPCLPEVANFFLWMLFSVACLQDAMVALIHKTLFNGI